MSSVSSATRSHAFSQLLTLEDEEAIAPALQNLKKTCPEVSIDLHIDLSSVWYGLTATLAKIEAVFGAIQSVTFFRSQKKSSQLDLVLPRSVERVVLDNIGYMPLSRVCKRLEKLKELRISGKMDDELCTEILTFSYPKSFEYLDAPITKRRFQYFKTVCYGVNNGVSDFYRGVFESGKTEHFQRCRELLPHFLQKQVSEKLLAPKEYASLDRYTVTYQDHIGALEDIVDSDPTHIPALLELLMLQSRSPSPYVGKICAHAAETHDITGIAVLFSLGVDLSTYNFEQFGLSPEDAQLLVTYLPKLQSGSATDVIAIDRFARKHGMKADTLVQPWINSWIMTADQQWRSTANIEAVYDYAHREEILTLQVELEEIVVKTNPAIVCARRLRELTRRIESNQMDGFAELVQKYLQLFVDNPCHACDLYLLLVQHSLLPDIRKTILEEVVTRINDLNFERIAHLILAGEFSTTNLDIKKLIQRELPNLLICGRMEQLLLGKALLDKLEILPVAKAAIIERLISGKEGEKEGRARTIAYVSDEYQDEAEMLRQARNKELDDEITTLMRELTLIERA